MKSMLLLFLVLASLLLAAGSANAQKRQPKWVPVKGYWVVEDNINQPGVAIVYFYNQQSELVYQETVNRRIDLDRRRTLLRLNRTLEEAVATWERRSPLAINTGVLARNMAE
ncbi:MAG: hypothetical protein EOO08_08570 [Chitinophagaceae bacterium]|nr:MAG: hypothetical protein EOO08_08570 [Chitinophagaceae bacterium]